LGVMQHHTSMTNRVLIIAALWSTIVSGCAKAPVSSDEDPVLPGVLETKPVSPGAPVRFAVARSDSLQARFLAVYIVDTTGAVDQSSVRFVAEARPAFRRGVCESLASTKYAPLHRAGRARRFVMVSEYRYLYRGNIPTEEPAGARYDSARAAIAGQGVNVALAQLANAPSC
jgi:hypothetical protein